MPSNKRTPPPEDSDVVPLEKLIEDSGKGNESLDLDLEFPGSLGDDDPLAGLAFGPSLFESSSSWNYWCASIGKSQAGRKCVASDSMPP